MSEESQLEHWLLKISLPKLEEIKRNSLLNNTVLSNFSKIQRLGLLSKLFDKILITEEVFQEYQRGVQRGLPPLNIPYEIIKLSEKEKNIALKLMKKLGKGEASSIAVAKMRNMFFFSDDKDARNEAKELNIKCHGTITILLMLVKYKFITFSEADKLLKEMIKKFYRSPIKSLRELIYII